MNWNFSRAFIITALLTACNPAADSQVLQQTPTIIDPSPSPPATQSASPSQAAEAMDFKEAPLVITSATGATVRLDRFEVGDDCLWLGFQVMGIVGPSDAPPDFEPPAPITDISLFEPGFDAILNLIPKGGGGGGGPASDGSFIIGIDRIFSLGSSIPQRPLQLLLKLTMDESLGFVEPVEFLAQATDAESRDCGLPGSISP